MKIFTNHTAPGVLSLLRNGHVGVLATDTLYGVVCIASNKRAVEKLYTLKLREQKPGTVIAANTQQLIELGIAPSEVKKRGHIWQLAVSVETNHDLAFLHQGTGRQAFRIVQSPPALVSLLLDTGPLLTSSANMPGKTPANTIDEAIKYFARNVDFYVDSGDLTGKSASTLVKLSDGKIEIIREGSIKLNSEGILNL